MMQRMHLCCMASNSFGRVFRLTTFGESHGMAIGGVLDGCPAGLEVDFGFIQQELDKRKPGQSSITTPRNESDHVEILSGIFEGKTLGTPIGFVIKNSDQNSRDYEAMKEIYRPGHGDYVYDKKYGHREYRGGGRSSARETACRVVAGAFAKILLKQQGVQIAAYVSSIKNVEASRMLSSLDFDFIWKNDVRTADHDVAEKMKATIEDAKSKGDSVGGTIVCVCRQVPAGWGDPIYEKLEAKLAEAMLSINAVKGFELMDGFASTTMYGSESNKLSSGISAGISNGDDLSFRVAFKPTSTIRMAQETTNKKGDKVLLEAEGRHDPCVLPRAVPIVEAMTAIVLADAMLCDRLAKV